MNQSIMPPRAMKARHLVVVGLMIGVTTLFHYGTAHTRVEYHTLYREFYFVPIILMSFWFGLRTGLKTALLIIVLYAPHVFMTWREQPGVNVGNILQLLVFLLVAAATGYLSDREKERQYQMLQSESLASLGKAALAMTSELQEVTNLLNMLPEKWQSKENAGYEKDLQHVVEKVNLLNQTLSHFNPAHAAQQRDFMEIDSAIERVRNKLSKAAQSRGIGIQTQLAATPGLVPMNEGNLLWILEELVKNAIDYSKPGKAITITSERFEDRFEIKVTDQGDGIAPENLIKIFVPFYTTKSKGTGLGLAVCKKLMKEAGGDVTVTSRLGEGSTFTLFFPRLPAKPAAASTT